MKLYIITASYPYGSREIFLENEVRYLSKNFDIELVPTYFFNNDREIRKLPDNVKSNRPIILNNFQRLIKSLFIFNFLKSELLEFKILLNQNSVSLINIKNFIISVSNRRLFFKSSVFKRIKNSKEDFILYFYWTNSLSLCINSISNKSFVRVHGGEIDFKRSNGYIPFINQILSLNTNFLPISNSCKNDLIKLNDKIKTTVNRLGTFNDIYDSHKSFYVSNFESKKKVIVSCSNLIPLKRIHLIIKALEGCRDEISWHHFGDGKLFSFLKNEANQKLTSNIEVNFHGHISNLELLNFYKNNYIDLFINVSESEGIPVSIMEAMSFGIPCFATDVGATNEIVNNSNGVLVKENFEIDLLKDTIETLKNSKFLTKRYLAYKTWFEKYNGKRNYKMLEEIFNAQKL